jgi:nucleotide-binding universal stress UspA family protein
MGKTKKIMVALALAEHSQGIFDYAVDLATSLNADLIVANVINERDVRAVSQVSSMGYNVDGEHYIAGVREERMRVGETIVKASAFPSDRVTTVVRVGNPVKELLAVAVEEKVDMIVMGPRGRTDLEHFRIGSVAEKLFRKSPITVVSYRDEKHATRLYNILDRYRRTDS